MKKIVIGIIIGAVLSFSGQAVADSLSKIGKKVQNEYTVVVNGEELSVKAIAIDGTSYTPNRALVDAINGEVDFKDGTVIIATEEEHPMTDEVTELDVTPTVDQGKTAEQIDGIIEGLKKELYAVKYALDLAKTDEQKDKINESISELEKKISELEKEKAQLESQQ